MSQNQNQFYAFFQKLAGQEKSRMVISTRTLPCQAVPKKALLRCNETVKTKVEIYLALNVVANNCSLNPCDITTVFSLPCFQTARLLRNTKWERPN